MDLMVGGENLLGGSCGGDGSEIVVRFVPERPGLYRLTTYWTNEGSQLDTVLYVTSMCGDLAGEIICNDDIADGVFTSEVDVEIGPAGEVFAVVDQFAETQPLPIGLRVQRLD